MIQLKFAIAKLLRTLTRGFVFKKKLPADFGKASIYVSSSADIRVLGSSLNPAAYDLFTVIRRLVRPSDVVWDIGSNLGIFTFAASIKVGSQGAVYSLEANPGYANLQTQTLAQFVECRSPIEILCAAASETHGIANFSIPKTGHTRSHLSEVASSDESNVSMIKQVVTLPLDWLLHHWKAPHFIKLDVEGAEVLVLKGATELIQKHRPGFYLECAVEHQAFVESLFRELNYDFYSIDSHGKLSLLDQLVFNNVIWPSERALPA